MKKFGYSTYLSPFTWRYGSDEMRKIWSEENKRKLWRKVWVALARAQHKQGLVSKKELDDLIKHQNDVDIEKAHEFEKEIKHDLMAEIKVYASQAKIGGGKIHLGATTMDIEDNVDALRNKQSLEFIEEKLINLLKEFSKKIDKYKDLICMGYTHLQPAEPTTLGYRFCLYAQDLLFDLQLLRFIKTIVKGKGMKGAIGTSASYTLLHGLKAQDIEKDIMKTLGLEYVEISSQTSPRKFEYLISIVLSSIAQSLYKFAFDIRILQSPGFGELMEPFGKDQVGSSAMPFKRNPWKSEQICSLARFVFHVASVTGSNASHMLLERTLDDSANRRVVIPELFLALDEMLTSTRNVLSAIFVNENNIQKNLSIHGPFSGIEVILLTAVKNGADRQKMHGILREHALNAYETIQRVEKNPLIQLLNNDKRITKFIKKKKIESLLNPAYHIGLANRKCKEFVKKLNNELSD